MLHETVLAGVVRNDCENTAWRQPVSERWERRLQSTQLVVHSDAHRLKDAREIAGSGARAQHSADRANQVIARLERPIAPPADDFTREPSRSRDRKSTRLNSSHSQISYAVFCLKKK